MSTSSETITLRRPQDVVELVNTGRISGGNSMAIVFIALGGVFIDAYDFTSLAFGVSDITEEFALSPGGEAVVTGSIMVGALLGALGGGYLVDKIGRYRMFMVDMFFFVVAAIACALAPTLETLIGARFLMGVGIGIDFPVALAFIAEYRASKDKGSSVTLWQPMWYAAIASSFAILLPFYFLMPESMHGDLWRIAVGFGAVPALVVLFVRHRYMAESPLWAANRGDLEGAAAILRKSYGVDARVADDAPPVKPPIAVTPRMFTRLWEARYRKRTVLASVVSVCQSMQYFAVGFYLTQITATLFDSGRLSGILVPLVFNAVFGVVGGFLGVRLIPRWGSKTLAQRGFFMTTILLVITGLISGGEPGGAAAYIGAVLIGLFVFFHAGGPGAQGMTMATLSYPTSLRGVGAGFAQAMLRVGSLAGLVFFPLASAAFGLQALVLLAIAPAIGFIATLVIDWEPVGRDIDAEDYEADRAGQPGFAPSPSPA